LRMDEQAKKMLGPPGTFKTAHPAYLTLSEFPVAWKDLPTQPILVSHRTPVAAKRRYFRETPGGPRLRFGVEDENRFLEQEANLLYWATSLHELAQSFASKFLSENPKSAASKLELPETCFVLGGLFQHGQESGNERSGLVVLIEELGSSFIKFINNSSPVPCVSEGPAGTVGRYLAFCQHVQYVKTGGLAIISDYQGSLTMLSDPQILTHPKLGPIFGDGNLSSSFEQFPLLHQCNEFCTGFELESL
ncbi:hypothetical protein CALCODRAFT_418388, partial [Calocera cornea HHB12733]